MENGRAREADKEERKKWKEGRREVQKVRRGVVKGKKIGKLGYSTGKMSMKTLISYFHACPVNWKGTCLPRTSDMRYENANIIIRKKPGKTY